MKKKTYFYIVMALTLLWLILPQTAQAAEYYLDAANGNDSNPGTEAQPWKTIARAQNYKAGYVPDGYDPMVAPGDTVWVKNGSYGIFRENTSDNPRESYYFERNNWITYKAATGHSPILTGINIRNYKPYDPNAGKAGSSYLIFDGFAVNGRVFIYYTNYVQVKNSTISGTSYNANDPVVELGSGHHTTIDSCIIRNGGEGIGGSGNYCTFSNNIIHHIGEDAFHFWGNYLTVENNDIYDVARVYAAGDDPNNYSSYHPDGMHLEHKEASITDVTIRCNKVHDCNDASVQAISIYGGEGANAWQHLKIENNLIYDMNCPDNLLIVVGVADCDIINNTVWSFVGGKARIHTHASYGGCVVTNLYNNIFRTFLVDEDKSGFTAQVVNHGNNIFGGNPNGQGGTYKFYTNSTELKSTTPVFVNASGDDYHLADGSVAINFGDPAYAPATDILGNPRDALPDAGSYEYISQTLLFGDVSDEGEISAYDAALTAQYAVGLISLTSGQIQKADVSGDGKVSVYDAALILQKVAGLISKFPVE